MLIETLTIAAGRLQFTVGEELDLPEKDARELIECGAAREVNPPKLPPKKSAGKAADPKPSED